MKLLVFSRVRSEHVASIVHFYRDVFVCQANNGVRLSVRVVKDVRMGTFRKNIEPAEIVTQLVVNFTQCNVGGKIRKVPAVGEERFELPCCFDDLLLRLW